MCGIILQCSHTSPTKFAPGHISLLRARGPDAFRTFQCCSEDGSSDREAVLNKSHPSHLALGASVLSLRGEGVCQQPLLDQSLGAIFAWNGEAWSYNAEPVHGNDTIFVFRQIQVIALSLPKDLPRSQLIALAIRETLSKVLGPFSFIFYDGPSSCVCTSESPGDLLSVFSWKTVGKDERNYIPPLTFGELWACADRVAGTKSMGGIS